MMTAASVDRKHETFIGWWHQQCQATPDRTAIVSEDGQWTYRKLQSMVNRLAMLLGNAGISAGCHVGLCVDRSPEAIAAMIAVMQVGAAFIPLDPEYPADRLSYMVQDGDIQTIIGHDRYRESLGQDFCQVQGSSNRWIACEEAMSLEDVSDEIQPISSIGTDLAYIMYTSGSTGKPKGVEISQQALATYCAADIECYRLTPDDRTLQFSTLCFDIAIEEIFPPLLSGGSVVIRPRGRADDHNELSSLINRFDITAIHLATAYWHSWVDLMVASKDQVPTTLRMVLATGEKVSVAHYRRWQSICKHEVLWCNAYGPTEATVTATVFIPEANFDAENMPIGTPLPGYTAYILDKDHKVIGDDATGELCIGGPALANGYHRRPDLTAKAFIEIDVNGKPTRLYRTGDVARWLPDGNIDFGGRFDHQIKLGSYRIEPGEIEAVINRADGVLESLVAYEEVESKKFLIAYVARGPSIIDASEVVNFLRQSLPAYMIPARYVMVDAFPKTINGKIDRDALPDPSESEVGSTGDHQPARNELERQLVDLWCKVLNLPDIGIHDDFFLLGGSSLLVTQVISRLTTDLDVDLPVRDFFANPTIATSAAQISHRLGLPAASTSASCDSNRLRNEMPKLIPSFFISGKHRLFSVRYRPPSGRIATQAVVLAHSIGPEYTRGYRNLQQLAVQLAKSGTEVLRFDYAGTGNSEGDSDDVTVPLMQRNLIDAKNHLIDQSDIESISVVGLRFGATLSASLRQGTFAKRIFWDPVISGQSMLQMFDRVHQQELTDLTRFNLVRIGDAGIDQACGFQMGERTRQSIGELALNAETDDTIVVTAGQSLDERLNGLPNLVKVADEIFWEDSCFIEAAFSSPDSFRQIQHALIDQNNSRSVRGQYE